LSKHMPLLDQIVTHYSSQLSETENEEKVRVAGLVTSARSHQTKTGKLMGFATIEDIQGTVDLVIFPKLWESSHELLQPNQLVAIEGKVDISGSEPHIIVDKVMTELSLTMSSEADMISSSKPSSSREEDISFIPVESTEELDNDMPPPPEAPPEWATFDQVPRGSQAGIKENPPSSQAADVSRTGLQTDPSIKLDEPRKLAEEKESQMHVAESGAAVYDVANHPPYIPAVPSLQNEEKNYTITVILRSNGDKKRDEIRVKQIVGTFMSFPGKDRFVFQIIEKERSFLIEFPNFTTKYCSDLVDRLRKFINADDLIIEIP
jgi:DNA polymerase III subunit alpha